MLRQTHSGSHNFVDGSGGEAFKNVVKLGREKVTYPESAPVSVVVFKASVLITASVAYALTGLAEA